jgi:ubiquinone/menaquinone biosynthesis C-methylase UbiE
MTTDRSAERYVGTTAIEYDKKRNTGFLNRLRWKSEMTTIRKILNGLPPQRHLMDIPCGTGRFFPALFENGHTVMGVDISPDMISQIPAEYIATYGDRLKLQTGDATKLAFDANAVDYIFSLRLFNLVTDEIRLAVLKEFRRVGRQGSVIQIRFSGPFELPGIRWSDAFRDIIHIGCWHLRGLAGTQKQRPTIRRRIPRPKYSEFRRMAEATGFKITACHKVFWGMTLSSMTMCVLEPF